VALAACSARPADSHLSVAARGYRKNVLADDEARAIWPNVAFIPPPPDWMKAAACVGLEPEFADKLFFPDRGHCRLGAGT